MPLRPRRSRLLTCPRRQRSSCRPRCRRQTWHGGRGSRAFATPDTPASSVLFAGPGRRGRVAEHGAQADGEPVDGLAGAREPVELVDRLVDAMPELCRPLVRYPGMSDEGAQLADLVRGGGLLGRDLEVVEVGRKHGALRVPADSHIASPCAWLAHPSDHGAAARPSSAGYPGRQPGPEKCSLPAVRQSPNTPTRSKRSCWSRPPNASSPSPAGRKPRGPATPWSSHRAPGMPFTTMVTSRAR